MIKIRQIVIIQTKPKQGTKSSHTPHSSSPSYQSPPPPPGMSGAGGGGGGAADSRVETISRLAQWRLESLGPCSYRRSEPFKLGIWNWYLSVEKSRSVCIRLFPEPGRVAKDQPPLARFILRVSYPGPPRRSCASPGIFFLLPFPPLLCYIASMLLHFTLIIPSFLLVQQTEQYSSWVCSTPRSHVFVLLPA